MKVTLILDSTADIPASLQQQVQTVPLSVFFGEEEYIDGITITHGEFYRRLETEKALPHTSQATPQAFAEVFEGIKKEGGSAVVLTLSHKLSGTYQSASIAAEDFENIYVVDSGSVAIGTGVLAIYAMQLIGQGASGRQVAQQLQKQCERVRVMAVLDTLEYLKRGGRISKAAALAGGLLNIKPVVQVQNGVIEMLGKARGERQGYAQLCQSIRQAGVDEQMPCMLGFTGQSAGRLQGWVQSGECPFAADTPQAAIGSVVGTHAGPGAVAAAFFVP